LEEDCEHVCETEHEKELEDTQVLQSALGINIHCEPVSKTILKDCL